MPQFRLLYFFLLSAIILLALARVAGAQVINVERHRVEADTVGVWAGGLGFGFNTSQNKSRVTRFNTSADLTYIAENHDYLLLGRNNFLRVEGDNVLNDGFLHLRSVLYRDRIYAPEMFLQIQYNLDWGLKRRALAGANLRIRLHQTDHFSAFVSSGFMYENEIWMDNDEEERAEFSYLKSTTSLNIRGQVSDHFGVAAISYYQARPGRFFTPRFTSDWQLRFRISDHLGFSVQFVCTLDADPPLQTTKFIYNINNLLEVRF
ncbi:MAG: DUF481 domain-containing protein [Balneolales bacterium]